MNIAAIVLLTSTLVGPHPDDLHERVIHRASDLVPWCREEAEAIVIGRGGTPYQWTASWHDRGDVIHVDGKLRVDGKDIGVSCRIARGARERYASLEFNEPYASKP